MFRTKLHSTTTLLSSFPGDRGHRRFAIRNFTQTNKIEIFFAEMLGILFIFALQGVALGVSDGLTCSVQSYEKRDCGYAGITEAQCLDQGCCWKEQSTNSAEPWCYDSGFTTKYSLQDLKKTRSGYTGKLTLSSGKNTQYGADIESLTMELLLEANDYVRLKITDPSEARWEVPSSMVDRKAEGASRLDIMYDVSFTETPFTVEVTRKSDGVTVFKTDETLVYKDQYLQITSITDSRAMTYGIGESTRTNHALHTKETYTLFAADIPAASLTSNLYGSFPMYIQNLLGKAHGAMLFNSNGMDVVLGSDSITFKAIGGIIDMYVFIGPAGDDVIEQYTAVVGRSMMPPYWSLGFHQCKYGYNTIYEVEDVVDNYAKSGIPLDTAWIDIDYMTLYRDFTSDPNSFPIAEVAGFIDKLHKQGQRFVEIIDPGIQQVDDYDSYTRGKDMDIFIKDVTGKDFLGQVWPGPTVFPDFLHPDIDEYWTKEISDYHSQVPVDGLWIDMNEVSNFCNVKGNEQSCVNSAPGGCPAEGASQTDCCLVCDTVDSLNKYDFPDYHIGNKLGEGMLNTKTMSMSSVQYGNVSVYNSHNIYGLSEAVATNKALTKITGQRPYLLSRSSFMGSGKFTTKWTGDNAATWDDLKSSIISIMDFSFFGIPMIGADICGFLGDTTEELCARWIEVGAFYPFSRNHNSLGQQPQELYLWDSVTNASKRALGMRYRLLPYLYTLFYKAHKSGSTVSRPLWFNFPDDTNTYNIDQQFMMGSSVLISPVLEDGARSVNAYFPWGLWYNFEDMSLAIDATTGETGIYKVLDTPLEATNVHIKGGSLIPLQDPAMTTVEGRETPFTFLAALCPGGKAFGSLFWDDGIQVNLDKTLKIDLEAEASGSSGFITSTVDSGSNYSTSNSVQTIVVLGKGLTKPSKVYVNGEETSNEVSFDETKNRLTFSINIPLGSSFKVEWK
jgi:alpha-D-xyloside xylohydrolase